MTGVIFNQQILAHRINVRGWNREWKPFKLNVKCDEDDQICFVLHKERETRETLPGRITKLLIEHKNYYHVSIKLCI